LVAAQVDPDPVAGAVTMYGRVHCPWLHGSLQLHAPQLPTQSLPVVDFCAGARGKTPATHTSTKSRSAVIIAIAQMF
jgi:hypothetical protein